MTESRNNLMRMDNVGIVDESLDDAIAFFTELGLTLEGRATIPGEWAGRITGLGNQEVEIAMMVTPDGHSRLELSRFINPPISTDHRRAPVNALGYLRVMFTVVDIDDTLRRLQKIGAELVGEVVKWLSMKKYTDCVTYAARKEFLSDSPNNSRMIETLSETLIILFSNFLQGWQ